MSRTYTKALSFVGNKSSLMEYLYSLELIERYEGLMGFDKPVTNRMLYRMPITKANERARTISRHWASA